MKAISWKNVALCCMIAMLIFSISCIENLEELPPEKSKLVIYGEINNLPGKITVRVFRTTGYGIPFEAISDAQVTILEDENTVVQLSGDRYGFYYENWAGGKLGSTYYLKVQLSNGQTYTSTPETIPQEKSTLESIRYDKGLNTYTFYADFTDNDLGRNFYRLRYLGYYSKGGPATNVASYLGPLPQALNECFGDRILSEFNGLSWYKDLDLEQLKVADDLLFNGKKVTNLQVATLPNNSKFSVGYIFNLRLHSISKNTHRYWGAISKQLNNKGSIFESANYNIRGNIFNEENPDEDVQGFFEVSNVSGINILFSPSHKNREPVCIP